MYPHIKHDFFTYEHLFDSPKNKILIQDFSIGNPAGENLGVFLKDLAPYSEKINADRTYLVKDKLTEELAGFFSLRNGLFALRKEDDSVLSIPSIELSNFAINDNYRQRNPHLKGMGKIIFTDFILPLVKFIQQFTGIQTLHIYAIPENRLIEHYKTFGFTRLSEEDEQFVYDRVKPAYDNGCIFMYQIL